MSDELFGFERNLYEAGFRCVVGIDEVGYGALAGPVTVAACVLDPSHPIAGLKDSKRFSSHEKRAEVAHEIRQNAVAYHIAHRPNTLIDDIGIVGALQEAQRECLSSLGIAPDKILIDGTPYSSTLDLGEEYIVKGDAAVACIAAASIIAKVARDELMIELAEAHPELAGYDIAKNKGYGTKMHREAIAEHGLSGFHRRCYCTNLL
jgi:ribonuclease HII